MDNKETIPVELQQDFDRVRKALDAMESAATRRHAELLQKIAAMTVDQRCARMQEITDSPDRDSEEKSLEFVKLMLGPDATIED